MCSKFVAKDSSATISKSALIVAAEEATKNSFAMSFPLDLYVTNEMDVKNLGAEPKVVFESVDPKIASNRNSEIMNSMIRVGGQCEYYRMSGSSFDRDRLKKLMVGRTGNAKIEEKKGLQWQTSSQTFGEPSGLKMANSRMSWWKRAQTADYSSFFSASQQLQEAQSANAAQGRNLQNALMMNEQAKRQSEDLSSQLNDINDQIEQLNAEGKQGTPEMQQALAQQRSIQQQLNNIGQQQKEKLNELIQQSSNPQMASGLKMARKMK
jgi:hypothetical protein